MIGRPSPKRTIHSRDWRWLLALSCVLGASCRPRAERTIKDTEGRSFSLQCSAERVCALSQVAGPGAAAPAAAKEPASNARVVDLRNTGRLVGVCTASAAESHPAASDCRPITCGGDADCPAAEGLNEGVCINGLCTEPSHALISDDAVMLCLAGTGVGPRTAERVERLALGLNCGNPCRVPKPCRQP